MRVRRIRETLDGLSYTLVDDDGQPIPVVSQFLGYLDARGCSPNTLSAYAYDLLHFTRFLHEQSWNYDDFTPARSLRFLNRPLKATRERRPLCSQLKRPRHTSESP